MDEYKDNRKRKYDRFHPSIVEEACEVAMSKLPDSPVGEDAMLYRYGWSDCIAWVREVLAKEKADG